MLKLLPTLILILSHSFETHRTLQKLLPTKSLHMNDSLEELTSLEAPPFAQPL